MDTPSEEVEGNDSVVNEFGVKLVGSLKLVQDPIPIFGTVSKKVDGKPASIVMVQKQINFDLKQFDKAPFSGWLELQCYAHKVFVKMCKRKLLSGYGYNLGDERNHTGLIDSAVNLHGWPPPLQLFDSKFDFPFQLMFSVVLHCRTSIAVIKLDWRIVLVERDISGIISFDLWGDSVETCCLVSNVNLVLVYGFVNVLLKRFSGKIEMVTELDAGVISKHYMYKLYVQNFSVRLHGDYASMDSLSDLFYPHRQELVIQQMVLLPRNTVHGNMQCTGMVCEPGGHARNFLDNEQVSNITFRPDLVNPYVHVNVKSVNNSDNSPYVVDDSATRNLSVSYSSLWKCFDFVEISISRGVIIWQIAWGVYGVCGPVSHKSTTVIVELYKQSGFVAADCTCSPGQMDVSVAKVVGCGTPVLGCQPSSPYSPKIGEMTSFAVDRHILDKSNVADYNLTPSKPNEFIAIVVVMEPIEDNAVPSLESSASHKSVNILFSDYRAGGRHHSLGYSISDEMVYKSVSVACLVFWIGHIGRAYKAVACVTVSIQQGDSWGRSVSYLLTTLISARRLYHNIGGSSYTSAGKVLQKEVYQRMEGCIKEWKSVLIFPVLLL